MSTSARPSSTRSLTRWLLNPFHDVAGAPALGLGLAVICLAGLLGVPTNTHFDGVLDLHSGRPLGWPLALAEGLIAWLTLALPLFLVGWLWSASRPRMIDVVGTQALARAPILLAVLVTWWPGYREATGALSTAAAGELADVQTAGMNTAILVSLVVIVPCTIWMGILMYRAWSVSTRLQGGKAIAVFIVILLVAEGLSKALVARAVRVLGEGGGGS